MERVGGGGGTNGTCLHSTTHQSGGGEGGTSGTCLQSTECMKDTPWGERGDQRYLSTKYSVYEEHTMGEGGGRGDQRYMSTKYSVYEGHTRGVGGDQFPTFSVFLNALKG